MTRSVADLLGGAAVKTFLGLPSGRTVNGRPALATVLGVPMATPYPDSGAYCAGGPAAIRAALAGYDAALANVDFDFGEPLFPDAAAVVTDLGDLACAAGAAPADRRLIHDTVVSLLAAGTVPVILGGDDSVQIPAIAAYASHGPIAVLQIDAHIDWRDEVHGIREGLSSTMRRVAEMPHVGTIVQVGRRALGSARPADLAAARARGVHFVPARTIARHGTAAVAELLPAGADIVIAFDCDGLDPSIMPAVIARAPGGLGYWHAVELIELAARRGRIAGFNLVEFMPERDLDGLGALTAARLVAVALGWAVRGRAGAGQRAER